MKAILGKKIGMTQVFDDQGRVIPVTVIEAGPCTVVRKRTSEKDGYQALQLGFGAVREKLLTRPVKGHFKRQGVRFLRWLREVKMDNSDSYEVGQEIRADIFSAGEAVDVIGVSKGKGFQGGIKRHRFGGGPASHGSMTHRQPASSGSTDAARTLKGTRKPGHLGATRVTALNLKVVRVDAERNLILVRGAVPGPNQGLVTVRASVKARK
jgi:large subunit ribosomal protein L3